MRVSLTTAVPDEGFWRAFESTFIGGLEPILEQMGATRAELRDAARTTGEVRRVVVDREPAGWLWLELRERTLHLHALLLDERFRRRGIGGGVLRLLEDEFTGRADELEAGVQDGNVGSARLLERAGFVEAGGRSDLGFRVLRKPLAAKHAGR
jgi:RimJ/RimL family protein N-acetyltransferase